MLVVACCFVPQLRAEGVSQENLILGKSEARDGQEMLTRHFPSGSGSPAYVLVPKEEQGSITAKLDIDKGIDAVSVLTTDTKLSSMPVGEARETFDQKIYSSVATERTKQLSALRAELETQWEIQEHTESNRITFSMYSGSEWNSPLEVRDYISDEQSGCFRIIRRFFMEAAEGHGVRFAAMVDTFAVIQPPQNGE